MDPICHSARLDLSDRQPYLAVTGTMAPGMNVPACEGQQGWGTLGQAGSVQAASLTPSRCGTLDTHRSLAKSSGAQSRSRMEPQEGREAEVSSALALGVCVPALGETLGSAQSFFQTRVDGLCRRAWRKVWKCKEGHLPTVKTIQGCPPVPSSRHVSTMSPASLLSLHLGSISLLIPLHPSQTSHEASQHLRPGRLLPGYQSSVSKRADHASLALFPSKKSGECASPSLQPP